LKIAAFYSDSPFASWSQSRGFGAVLRRMGHDVTEIMVPPTKKVLRSQVAKINKSIDDCKLILVSGPEHLKDWINQFYPQWEKLKAPKVGWYHESFEAREDYKLCYQNYEKMFDFHFFPDKDDAEKFEGSWLPLGVDVKAFNTGIWTTDSNKYGGRDIDSAFIGLMYPKRARFYEELRPFLKDLKVRVANGNILVHDFDGINLEESTDLLARTYRRIKVFVAFPSVCNVLVAKILESMACGCYLVAPKQPVELGNYASYDNPKRCAKEIRHALELTEYRERIARQGCEEVHQNHRMEQRFEQIFKIVGAKECVSALPAPGDLSATTSPAASANLATR
jgi:hypothetical protein